MKILAQKGESSSRKQVCQTLLENWPKLSSFLDSLWETGLFSEPTFQNQIVGLAESDAQLQQVKGQFVGALQEFLSSSLPVDADAEFLSEFESQCNLCLWWWCGQGHKNLNFGRLVLSLGVLPSVVSKVCGLNVLLSTQGLMFSATEEAMDRSPQRASPIPGQFQNFLREHGSSFSTESAADVSLRFLRNLQRQVCLVIEHWEAANALLAVQHGALMKQRKVLDQESFHTSLAELQDHMAQVRDHEALWCLGAFREVQECLQAPYFSAPQDLQSEKLATRSLLFGALQKICLPSSVSRHRYCDTVIDQFFAILRAEQQSEDSCASLMISSMGFKWAKLVSLGDSVEQSSLKDVRQIREMDPRHCDLGFECSHFLKIISWKLSFAQCRFLTLSYFNLLFRKFEPSLPQNHFWEMLADSLAMPNSFPEPPSQEWYGRLSEPQQDLFAMESAELCEQLLGKLTDSHSFVGADLSEYLLKQLSSQALS